MKPQNNTQRRMVEARMKLPPITDKQIEWGSKNLIEHIGRRNVRGMITCTECNHTWREEEFSKTAKCPHCGTDLKIETTAKRVFTDCTYYRVITTCGGFQVFRQVLIRSKHKIGEQPKYDHTEVFQRWIATDGRCGTFAKLRQTMGTLYYDAWIISTPLELRGDSPVYDNLANFPLYPRKKILPELKRMKINAGEFPRSLYDFYRVMLADKRAETLLKTGKTEIFKLLLNDRSRRLSDYWPSICICDRNKYQIKDASLWCDYIDFLRALHKDVHNAKYVCPADLLAEHYTYMIMKQNLDERREAKRAVKRAEKEAREVQTLNDKVQKRNAKFAKLEFTNGNIVVRALQTIEEYKQEGEILHHCVFISGYYKNPNSLILSATINGEKIETVEVSISNLAIVQCRGLMNRNSEYHDQIVNLVNANMNLIHKRVAA